jgi:oligopeptide transport system substrate-binding protein
MQTPRAWTAVLSLILLSAVLLSVLSACAPSEPELVVATEVIQLGDEQIVITRLVELQPTEAPTIPPPTPAPEPIALDIAYESSLPDLDPQHVTNRASLDFAESLFAGLTNFNNITSMVEPELAESWIVSADGRTWTFALRDDINWIAPPINQADMVGEVASTIIRPVDALDVQFALQRACTMENAIPDAFLLFIIEGCEAIYSLADPTPADLEQLAVKVIDENTVEIRLVQPASYFLTILTLAQFRPVPRELVEEHGDAWRDAVGELADGWQTPPNLVISGPFVPQLATLDETHLTLARNPLWPLAPSGNIDRVNAIFEKSAADIYAAWQDRELDTGLLPVDERESLLAATPEKAKLLTNQTVFYVGFNFDSAVFREPELRRAFATAIDRDALISDMFEGRAQPLRHLTPPGVFGAPPAAEVGVGYSPDFALLQMDKSSIRSCKLIPPVTFLVSTADLSLLQAELIRDMWIDELGCDEQLIQIEQTDFGDLLARTASGAGGARPDMWELAWPAYYPDAHNILFDLLQCNSGENRQNRSCSEVDSLLSEASTATSPQERIELYREAENSFFADQGSFPLIPLYVRGDYLLVQTWLSFPPALSGGEQFDTYVVDQELKRLERSRS